VGIRSEVAAAPSRAGSVRRLRSAASSAGELMKAGSQCQNQRPSAIGLPQVLAQPIEFRRPGAVREVGRDGVSRLLKRTEALGRPCRHELADSARAGRLLERGNVDQHQAKGECRMVSKRGGRGVAAEGSADQHRRSAEEVDDTDDFAAEAVKAVVVIW
jgi:hypothetical protein